MAQTIGEQLKQAREKRGLTLEQVSQATHIRKYYLEALENDQRDALPSPVQGRGFLRLYAGLLDLPAAGLLAAWDGILPAEPEQAPLETPDRPADEEESEPAETVPPSPAVFPLEDLPAEAQTGSPAIFRAIGEDLRIQRESLGLSRAEVERFIRLRQHYIQALEEGKMENLPSPVQGRGMLSNYVKFLNMDEEKILLRFAEGLQARRIERIPRPEPGALPSKRRPARQAPFWRRFLTPDLVFGVGVVVIILFFVVWSSARINTLRSAEVKPTPPGISDVLLTPRPGQGTPSPAATLLNAAATGDAVSAGETTEAAPEKPTATPVNNPNLDLTPVDATSAPVDNEKPVKPGAAPTAAPATPTGITTPTVVPLNGDPIQVYIVAHQRAWLKVTADDKLKFLGRTVPGNAYAFSGAKRIELATGNAAALQVFYNSNDLGTLGTMGQALALIFASGGMMTPTPAFTPTGTPTKMATLTPFPTATLPPTPTITPYVPPQ